MSKFFNNSCNEKVSEFLQEESQRKDDNDEYSGRNLRIRKVSFFNKINKAIRN